MSSVKDEWENRDETREEQKQRLRNAIEEHEKDLETTSRDALAALKSGAETREQLKEVDLNGQEITVKTSLSGSGERKMQKIERANEIDEFVGIAADVLAELAQTEGYDDPAVWELYYEELGSRHLIHAWETLLEPVREASEKQRKQMEEKYEQVDGFRQK